jgi:selenium metabolism protein YedF
MKQTIDCRGLACPQPVINAKKALETADEVEVIVDGDTSSGNVRRMAESLGCTVTEKDNDGAILLSIKRIGSPAPASQTGRITCATYGPRVLLVSQNVMGKGDDELGTILVQSFFHTMAETPSSLDIIIFLNSGVKLAVKGSETLEDIRALELRGIRVLACGTCLDFFKIKDKLAVGTVSNMYDIKDLMMTASSVVSF